MTPPRSSLAPSRAGGADSRAPADPSAGSRARIALLLASIALVLAGLGLAVGAASFLRGGDDACRTAAWDSEPAAGDLPAGWTVSTSQVGIQGLGVSLVGTATDEATDAPTIYVTVSCYGADAGAALARSRDRIEAAGEAVTARTDLGDDGYGLSDSTSGALAVHFRRGALVAYAATSGTVAQSDLDAVAAAVDTGMRRALGVGDPQAPATSQASSPDTASSGGPSPSASAAPSATTGAEASPSASPDQAAPELVALLPAEFAGTTLVRDSASGADVLGDDSVSRALAAALRSLGATVDDLRVAQAYDETGTLDLYLLAFSVSGVSGSKLEPAILDTWLSAGADGVTTKTATVGGKEVTIVDYGDGGAISYVRTTADAVVVLQTADAALAAVVVAVLP